MGCYLTELYDNFSMRLDIGLITDIHYGPDSPTVQGSAALELLSEGLASLKARQPELLVDLGDRLTDVTADLDRSRLKTVADQFRSVAIPRQHIRGNHDVLPLGVQEAMLGGALSNRYLDVAGWHLVFLDSFNGSIGGALSDETLRWLEKDLASTELPVVVFSHQPLDGQPLIGNPIFEVDYAADAHPNGHTGARRIMEMAGNVRLAVNGHTHWNHLTVVNGVPYLSVQSLVARTESGEAVGAYAMLSLGEKDIKAHVFGRKPFEINL